jgi:hypothetical protein
MCSRESLPAHVADRARGGDRRYIGWDRVEAHRLARAIEAIAARAEPVDLSSLQAPLPSPAHQEAAQLYVEAAARAQDIASRDFGLSRFDVDAVVGHVDVAAWEDAYRKDAPAMQLLDRAVTLPFAGFGDAFDGPDWMNVRGLQALGALAALRADLLAYRGNGEAAASALIAALGVQRTLPDLSNRYFVSVRQLGSLRILLRHTAPPPASLDALQRAFAGLPDEDGLDRDLILRRARLVEQAETFATSRVSAAAAFAFHPFLTRLVRVEIEQFPDVIAAAREPWPDKYVTLSALAATDAPRSNRSFLRSALAGQTLNIAALSAAPAQAGLNLATAALPSRRWRSNAFAARTTARCRRRSTRSSPRSCRPCRSIPSPDTQSCSSRRATAISSTASTRIGPTAAEGSTVPAP